MNPLYANVFNTFMVLHQQKNFEYFVQLIQGTLTTTDEAVRCFECIFSIALENKVFKNSFVWLAEALQGANIKIGEFVMKGTVRRSQENCALIDAKITYTFCQTSYSHTLRLQSGDVVGGFVTMP